MEEISEHVLVIDVRGGCLNLILNIFACNIIEVFNILRFVL